MNTISLADKYLTRIKDILNKELGCMHARALIFGSRARGNARESSDIDLAIEAKENIRLHIAHIREQLEESPIPYELRPASKRKS